MKHPDLFANRTAVLITKHKKDEVIFPVLAQTGMNLKLLDTIDTDTFGTFTRDIDRKGTQLEAARYKALKAIEETGESIAIASEGSFGSHPTIFFAPANVELVLLIDTINDIEIAGWEISTDTNHSHSEVSSVKEALKFAKQCGFPSHGLAVRPNTGGDNSDILFKGITSEKILKEAVNKSIAESLDGKALLEPDMRAIYNPKRMKVIEKATINLLSKIKSLCPECGWLGFEITEWINGLPCENCFFPTRGIAKHIYQCKKCNHKKEIEYPYNQKYSEPTFCDFCNP
ncbi:MAG: hypothetical protein HUU48_07160 [Flavobacteriales bacterium]|nr:hypothetical protein [Flavobacteriales bacterium]